MSEPEIDGDVAIRIGLPPEMRREAARLFYEAFHEQLRSFLPTQELAEELLSDDLDMERVIVALLGDRLIGFAGMSYGNRNYCTFALRDFVTRFGRIAGPVRYYAYQSGARRRPAGELVVDGIGVTEALRGRGVGERLLSAVCDFASEMGFRAVRLEVADNNTPARRLYTRCGFSTVRIRRLPPFLVRSAGYATDIEMRRIL